MSIGGIFQYHEQRLIDVTHWESIVVRYSQRNIRESPPREGRAMSIGGVHRWASMVMVPVVLAGHLFLERLRGFELGKVCSLSIPKCSLESVPAGILLVTCKGFASRAGFPPAGPGCGTWVWWCVMERVGAGVSPGCRANRKGTPYAPPRREPFAKYGYFPNYLALVLSFLPSCFHLFV